MNDLEKLLDDYEDAMGEWSPDIQKESMKLLVAAREELDKLKRALWRVLHDDSVPPEHIASEALADDRPGDNYGVCSKCKGLLIEYTTVGCPGCDNPPKSDDTPSGNDARVEALEALEQLQEAVESEESTLFNNVGGAKKLADTVRRALTAPPTVPEAVNIERMARYFIHYLPDHLKPERGSSLQPYMDALDRTLAQHSEPGRIPEGLSFAQLRAANVERCETAFHALDHWNPMEWGAACAGEVGEAINAAKKLRRVQDSEQYKQTLPTTDVTLQDVADEIADAVIYADLWAASIGVDLGAAVADKFNRISEKVQSDVRLTAPAPDAYEREDR